MIIFFGDGRLGNQIFQYCFIKSIDNKRQKIITYNFEHIKLLFESIYDVINIKNQYIKFLIMKIAIPLLVFLSKTKIISSYKINEYIEKDCLVPDITFTKKKGLLPIKYIYPCFAQSENFFLPEVAKTLVIKKIYQEKAVNFLELIPSNFNKVFVHIRRGDYIHYSVLGEVGATLPITYYKNCIEWFTKNITDPFFVFLTDDPEFVDCCFDNINYKVISKNSMFIDFAIITLCEYGVLSNSSFSWWASYMMKNRIKVFSPKYWLGWKSKIEYPKGVVPSFSDVMDIGI